MARYTDSVCRQCRREGEKLFLKGDRCYSAKCAVIKRHTPPGQHGQARQRKQSEYGLQLREKQKCRRAYGISESQFRKYYDMASNILYLLFSMLRVCAWQIDLVYNRHYFKRVIERKVYVGKRLRLYALCCVNNKHRTLACGKAP